MLPITFIGRTRTDPVLALVDTGASESVLPMSFVDDGLIEPRFDGIETGTLTAPDSGGFVAQYGSIDVELRLGDSVHRWGTKVGFSRERDEPVLGDAWFFRFFDVLFKRRERVFIVDHGREFARSGGMLPGLIRFDR